MLNDPEEIEDDKCPECGELDGDHEPGCTEDPDYVDEDEEDEDDD